MDVLRASARPSSSQAASLTLSVQVFAVSALFCTSQNRSLLRLAFSTPLVSADPASSPPQTSSGTSSTRHLALLVASAPIAVAPSGRPQRVSGFFFSSTCVASRSVALEEGEHTC